MKNESLFTENMSSVKRAFILWDGLGLIRRGSGIFHHGENLYGALANHGIRPKVCFPQVSEHQFVHAADATVLETPWYGARLGQLKFVWPQRVEAYWAKQPVPTPRIFHALANINVPWEKRFHRDWKTVLTIHDLIPILMPENSWALHLQMKMAYEVILKQVRHIICVSEWTKSTLVERYPYVAKKVSVVPNGFPSFQGKQRVFSSDRVNVLTVSRYEPYKKFDDLLRIIEAAASKFHFHIVTNEQGNQWLRRYASDAAIKKMSLFVRISDEEMRQKYQEADIYLHTSLYEGFGLPIADALAHGLAVVHRHGSAVDEVAGKVGGIPVSRSSGVDEWLHALIKASQTLESSTFQAMLRADVEQRPGWDDAAVQLCAIYANLLTNA